MGAVEAGHGPPCCWASLTVTPVGHWFQMTRPAYRASRSSIRSPASSSAPAAWTVPVSVPSNSARASSTSSGDRRSTSSPATATSATTCVRDSTGSPMRWRTGPPNRLSRWPRPSSWTRSAGPAVRSSACCSRSWPAPTPPLPRTITRHGERGSRKDWPRSGASGRRSPVTGRWWTPSPRPGTPWARAPARGGWPRRRCGAPRPPPPSAPAGGAPPTSESAPSACPTPALWTSRCCSGAGRGWRVTPGGLADHLPAAGSR